MQRLATFASPRMTAAELAAAIQERPAFREYLDNSETGFRSKTRTRMLNAGYSPDKVDVVIPIYKSGPRSGRDLGQTFRGLSGPARTAIADALKLKAFPLDVSTWSDPETVNRATDTIVGLYSNPSSASYALTAFRGGLDDLGVPEAIRRVSARPDVSRAHQAKMDLAREEKESTGFESPPEYSRIADLVERVERYVSEGKQWVPDGLAVADFSVAFSARRGELGTLSLGSRGGIQGALKKRGRHEEYHLVTAIGRDLALKFLEIWRQLTQAAKRHAMQALDIQLAKWNIHHRDLRAIGATLALRAAQIEGGADTLTRSRDVQIGALRHEPRQTQAVDHYGRVVTPHAQLAAQIAELSDEKIAAIMAIVNAA